MLAELTRALAVGAFGVVVVCVTAWGIYRGRRP